MPETGNKQRTVTSRSAHAGTRTLGGTGLGKLYKLPSQEQTSEYSVKQSTNDGEDGRGVQLYEYEVQLIQVNWAERTSVRDFMRHTVRLILPGMSYMRLKANMR